jgi:predicted alpha-1,2-mannosidase
MPVLGDVLNPLANLNDTREDPDITSVGYYKAATVSNITVELSATSRAGFYQYTFPPGQQANVVVDVSHVLPSFRGQGLSQNYLGGNITTSDTHYEGYGSYDNGWNRAPEWGIYFCGYFDSPARIKTFEGTNQTSTNLKAFTTAANVSSSARVGAVFSFKTTTVTSRVGISFISTVQACENVNNQIPAGTTLSNLTSNAKKVWSDEVLSRVTTTETKKENLQLLYSSMYFMHLLPSNRTGENPLWESNEPYYDDTFTSWDLFRCTFSLLQVFQPSFYEEYIRSLIDIFRFEGYMPDARSSNFNGASQGGSNSDNILADAYVKGVRGAVDWNTGYEAMVKNAEVVPENNNDPRDLSSSTKEGRGALPDWLSLGYITPKYGRAVTRAVEYSVNDFSLAQVAFELGKAEDAKKYFGRSHNWRNHWNPSATALNFTGFMVPRSTEGYIDQNPLSCDGCYWGDAYYEALPWEYSFNAHHDINTLIALSGGPETFVNRLETTFMPGANPSGRSAAFNNTIFNPGNEPSFTTPYLYNYVGRQDLSVKQSRNIAKSYYSATPGGLPGNSDAGAMESWLLWNMLGLYPIVGQTTFLIGSPWFANTTISLGHGKSLTVTTANGSDSSFYVQSLDVNGKPWTQSWVTWDDVFANGGTMDFVLGPNPVKWATGPAPPSPGSEFGVDTPAAVIIPPGKVPMAPKPKDMDRLRRRKHLLRNVALALMTLAIVWAIAGALTIWWYRSIKAKKNAGVENNDKEKGQREADEKGDGELTGKPLIFRHEHLNWRKWLRINASGVEIPPSPNLTLTAEAEIVGEENAIERMESTKKSLNVSVRETAAVSDPKESGLLGPPVAENSTPVNTGK